MRSRSMHRFRSTALILFLSFFVCSIAIAANENQTVIDAISARAEASKGTLTVGELIECKLIVKYKKDVEILSGISTPEIAGLEIKNTRDWSDKEGAYKIIGKTFSITGYQVGDFILGSVEISYRESNGIIKQIQTNPVYISVKSVAAGEEKIDIRDVKGVVMLPYEWLKYAWPTIILLGVVLLSALAIFYYRKQQLLNAGVLERLSPEQQALRDLYELFDSSHIRDGRIKQYYLSFSEIIKIFLEKQFGIQATEATTSEIARLSKRLSLPEESKRNLIEILEAADFAKFAKWIPSPSEIIILNKRAEALIHELAVSTTPNTLETFHAVS